MIGFNFTNILIVKACKKVLPASAGSGKFNQLCGLISPEQ
jgi:hypothetical protein